MAKFKLGVKSSDIEQEELERIKKAEREVQKINAIQSQKLRVILRRRKMMNILVYVLTSLVIIALLVFGTYSTFFKRGISKEDVVSTIKTSVKRFPTEGIEGYVYSSFLDWFRSYVSYDDKLLKQIYPDLRTIRIDEIRPISATYATVYFSVDCRSLAVDKKEGDKTVEGAIIDDRLSFYIPLEYRYNFNKNGKPISAGYVPVAPMAYNPMKNYNSNQVKNDSTQLVFSGDKEDTKVIESAKIKVDKILSDLYANKDVSQDITAKYSFNDIIKSTYLGLDEFTMYKAPNALGYNAIIKYTIMTERGIKISNTSYITVEKSGASWVISKIQW